MSPKFINVLMSKMESEPCGRGDFASFVGGYRLAPVYVDMETFFLAEKSELTCRNHYNSDNTHVEVIRLRFAKGELCETYYVTLDEFCRVFGGTHWPLHEQHLMENVLVIRPAGHIDKENANVIPH